MDPETAALIEAAVQRILAERGAGANGRSRASMSAYERALGDEDRDRFDIGEARLSRSLDITERNNEELRRQARRALEEGRRQYDLGREDRRREFDLDYGLRQGDQQLTRDRFGFSIVEANANKRGARDWIQGDMLAQGSATYSPYLRSLETGTNVPYGGGTARAANPTPLTVQTTANLISRQNPTAAGGMVSTANDAGAAPGLDTYGRPLLSPDAQRAVDATAKIWQEGISNRPLGWWERMTKGQQDAFRSQSDYLGEDTESGLEYLRRSRPRQGSALSA